MSNTIADQLESVVANIKRVRGVRNYTQEYIAGKLRITQNAYSKIEQGSSALSVLRLFDIAEALDVTVNDLIQLNPSQLAPTPIKRLS